MSDDTYNGWVNRETWAVALHLSNDHGLYLETRGLVTELGVNRAAEAIREWIESEVEAVLHPEPGDDPPAEWVRMMMSDTGSFWRVDWRAVAEFFEEE
jgi:hypothetical protein